MTKRAILASVEISDKDIVKISLDDLIQTNKPNWVYDGLYTFKEYDKNKLERLDFDDKELADFGYSIIARLYAFYKQGDI